MRLFLRIFAVVLLVSASTALLAAPGTACPPVMGERESMLGVVHAVGLTNQLGRLCGVPDLAIQRKTERAMGTLKACLVERNIGAGEISAEMQKGAVDAKQGYEQSGAKAEMCSSVRDQFAE